MTKTFNELIYEFKLNKSLNLIIIIDLSQQFKLIKIDVIDIINFAQMNQKFHYNCHYQLMYFKRNDKVFLKLHHDYSISIVNVKFN